MKTKLPILIGALTFLIVVGGVVNAQSFVNPGDLVVEQTYTLQGADNRSEWDDTFVNKLDMVSAPAPVKQSNPSAVPEASTMIGFGAAIALNGAGVAGSKYYLRRKYAKAQGANVKRASRLPMYADAVLSATLLLVLSPLLLLVAANGALRSGKPALFK